MALSNRINMRGGGGAEPTRMFLYKDGVWNVGYDNPGGYTYSGNTPTGFTLDTDKMYSSTNALQMIGTTNKVDLSNYTTLHVVAKALAAECDFGIFNGKGTDRVGVSAIATIGSVVDYALDVSLLNGSYYIAIWSIVASACEVYEIYLE